MAEFSPSERLFKAVLGPALLSVWWYFAPDYQTLLSTPLSKLTRRSRLDQSGVRFRTAGQSLWMFRMLIPKAMPLSEPGKAAGEALCGGAGVTRRDATGALGAAAGGPANAPEQKPRRSGAGLNELFQGVGNIPTLSWIRLQAVHPSSV
jgi:hypothetical protein